MPWLALVAVLSLDKEMLKAVVATNRWSSFPDANGYAAWAHYQEASQEQACGLLQIAVPSFRYQSRRNEFCKAR